MKFNIFKRKSESSENIQLEWNQKGRQYAIEINQMMEFGENNGWENWKGKEPEDKRDHLADKVLELLKQANDKNQINEFREKFPPAHSPFVKYFESKGQSIDQVYFIENEKIVFIIGTAYQKRQAYILDNQELVILDKSIDSIGKSKKGNVFAYQTGNKITTTKGWQGEIINEFEIIENKDVGITKLIPFNDGNKLLTVTSEGIYLISKDNEKMIFPEPDLEDEEWDSNIDMENGTISNDNQYIVAGSQMSDHEVFNSQGEKIGEIGPQSEYPHFCLFSEDDDQLISNSCHFYNGKTIGVQSKTLKGVAIEAWQEDSNYQTIDENMRVYNGIAVDDFYILGDAYGYIRAIDKQGNLRWRHFLGSSIGGIAISNNKETLWVASCTGIIHKLKLNKGHRDEHTIGTGNHFEEFRIILWKGESILKW